MPFKKGHAPIGGRPKGAKSKICESFYQDWLVAYSDPRIGRSEGLIKFALASAHNMAIFLSWGARTMPSSVNLGNAPTASGRAGQFIVKVIHVKGSGQGNGNGNGDGHK